MSRSRSLPVIPSGCTLDDSHLSEQLDRYRRLGHAARDIQERDLQLEIEFGADVDGDLLREAIAIEHRCCRFFALAYDPSPRRLTIAIDDPAGVDALRTIRAAVGDPRRQPRAGHDRA
jgi:hypothetical protein